ncbi:MAG TPA: trehalose-6-phosphate synthase [Verrucomicrobiae bacterium]|nr:trehalose-6-phosphate synthase [Verrucomicrobiae bacterium]
MWTKETLQNTFKERMSDYRLVIASNRQPYHHTLKAGKIVCQREPGGLVTALDPVMQAVNGTWVAVGTSEQDLRTVGPDGKVKMPPEDPSYFLQRIFLSKEERDQYYYGYSNQGLWPLCHIAYNRPIFLEQDWRAYQKVNRLFADRILEEVGDQKAFVWLQDFHLALAAKYLREAGKPNLVISLFWHIPWPNAEVFSICPQKKEILEGFLACDLVGFQVKYHSDNFMATVDRELESRIDREKNSVIYQNHETLVRPFPISVDFDTISSRAESAPFLKRAEEIRDEHALQGMKLIVGVDRIDYTKGIPEKLRAYDRFLEKYPEFKQKVVFFQLGQISRLHIPRYKQLNDEINALVEGINWKHGQDAWTPVIFTRAYMPYSDILALYRMADVCLVGSLHDGMNLVAKEFVACRSDMKGVLALSQFTGAARELTEALLMNPFDPESLADTLCQALQMSAEEQEKRMRKMRETVSYSNIFRWAGKVLSQLLKFEFQEA